MTSFKNFLAATFGIMGALILAPFVAFFGLFMLGLSFGLSLIAAGVVTSMAKQARAQEEATVDAKPAAPTATPMAATDTAAADADAAAQPA